MIGSSNRYQLQKNVRLYSGQLTRIELVALKLKIILPLHCYGALRQAFNFQVKSDKSGVNV